MKSIRWSEADGKTVIADGANDTHVVACNADGTVAVGYFVEAGIHRPFRWSSATGLVELTLSLPGYRGEWNASFDANGFAGGCTPQDFLFPSP